MESEEIGMKEGREDKSELENSNERGEDRIKEEGKW